MGKNCKCLEKIPKKLEKNFFFPRDLLNVSVADVVKFALTRVKSVIFFSRIFISHVEDYDLFGGFTDIGFVFPRIVLHGTDLEFSKIFGKSKIKKKNNRNTILFTKKFLTKLCVFQKFENFRKFSQF